MTKGKKDKDTVPIGLVFSLTGSYSTIGQEMHNGAMLAVQEVNACDDFDFKLVPTTQDPGGDLTNYRTMCEGLLRQGMRHVVGCYTSISRKEVIPVFEKLDGLLWYPSHYEGFEHCGNVIYSGASPNQHIVPLAAYMLQEYGDRAYCIGSNYIWAWENNRILREIMTGCGGTVEFERYLPVGSLDVDRIVSEILAVKPSFVFSSFIGTSSYAFMEKFQSARRQFEGLEAGEIPICSCTLSEPELKKLSPAAVSGHIASSVYFQSMKREENDRFVAAYKKRFGAQSVTSADAEASYNAVKLLALAIQRSQSQNIDDVKQALYSIEFEAPQGLVKVDQDNNHCYLTPSLGISNKDGQFDIIWSSSKFVKPDPYLVNFNSQEFYKNVKLKNGPSTRKDRTRLRMVQ
ncbi:transporter substrate-binding domain-containing protein [Rhizobiales bacterium]|uniref:transporter substrate-binding domain-containing protein n=1 Tax=Hongsoonwoonella zoysiae TaxID=2821844 RepID=UPI001560AA3B|nr:transporter substrate-binding domain-containing protein [Hongsoonwoonella zoysiae]NRG16240.1 transporter substrate-binding domain-containing protein [Hongsoonwoonella zoysiae]